MPVGVRQTISSAQKIKEERGSTLWRAWLHSGTICSFSPRGLKLRGSRQLGQMGDSASSSGSGSQEQCQGHL